MYILPECTISVSCFMQEPLIDPTVKPAVVPVAKKEDDRVVKGDHGIIRQPGPPEMPESKPQVCGVGVAWVGPSGWLSQECGVGGSIWVAVTRVWCGWVHLGGCHMRVVWVGPSGWLSHECGVGGVHLGDCLMSVVWVGPSGWLSHECGVGGSIKIQLNYIRTYVLV